MWTISQVAERDGVSRQAVSKSVRRLAEENGLAVDRDGQGRITALNIADYDALRGRFADPSKAQAPAPARGEGEDGESYNEALRRKTWYEAERRRIDLDTLKGELIEVRKITEALSIAAEEIVRLVDRLPNLADDLAAAVAREGSHGGRVVLRQHAARLRAEISASLQVLAAPKITEPPPPEPP